ncbi:MAG: phosphoglucosamine mutase [Gemmatimonadetes bacterium]|nr:phosphoglucosamine mutase [Gemmatimonadota bacterium]
MATGLIVSVSGVRGIVGTDLVPELVARLAASFGLLVAKGHDPAVVLGRDARVSGPMFAAAAQAGLQSVGCRVVDLGLVPTPTLQLAVKHHHAAGGIAITASHNPAEWNALKFVGPDGLFLDGADARELVERAERGDLGRSTWDRVGAVAHDEGAVRRHVDAVLRLEVLRPARVRRRKLTVALDCVRGAGGTIMPLLLRRLGCRVVGMDLEPDGRFPRAPEPVPEHLGALGELVRRRRADLGMAVDPDVDRLALVNERGEPIGEDYTLAFAVRAVLDRADRRTGGRAVGPETAVRRPPGRPTVVINLSTSLVVEDAARGCGAEVIRAPVGEANVARAMREAGAVIGGEGNGGVILPALHLGRDAPVGAALVLELVTRTRKTVSELVAEEPRYTIVKAKASRGPDLALAYGELRRRFPDAHPDQQDGLRLTWADRWLHVRPSGTEPVVRLVAEAPTGEAALQLIGAGREVLERERTAVCAG